MGSKTGPAANFAEVKKLGLIIDVVPRTVHDRFIWILGERFDAEDMYKTLTEVRCNPSRIYITSDRMVKALANISVIKSTSPSWGTIVASEERLDQFIDMLREALRASKSEMVD